MNSTTKEENISSDCNSNFDNNAWRWKPASIKRNEYKKIALKAEQEGDYNKSILYDSKALSCGFIQKILNHDDRSKAIDDPSMNQTLDLQSKTGNVLIDHLSELMNNVVFEETNIDEDDQVQFNNLQVKYTQLPKQWNVIQFSQLYSGYNGYGSVKDLYTSEAPIKITLFRDNMSEKRNNQPTSIILPFIEMGEKSILSTMYEVNQVMFENYTSYMNTPEYSAFMKSLKQAQLKLLNDMTAWLGPWITLLSGKVKGKNGEAYEQKLLNDVNKFTNDDGTFTKNQYVLLSLLARRIDLLDNQKIEQAANDIARNHDECIRITNFLIDLKNKAAFNDFAYYPCILIIDEILDPLPWEMLLPSQEFTRIHSIYLLLDLYDKYKDQIEDGYHKISIKNGFVLINPNDDKKLDDMCKRMISYYSDYLPKWKRIEKQTPSPEQMTESLTKSDLFVYSGHGSCLQFLEKMEFEQIEHNCPMLLFGCESMAMKPGGTICEAMSSSYTHFKNGCPGILGALTIVTDIWADLITIWLLTQWVAPRSATHPKIEICKDERSKEHVGKILLKSEGKRNPNLLALLCELRNETDISFGMRSAMVFRGLPTYNTFAGKE